MYFFPFGRGKNLYKECVKVITNLRIILHWKCWKTPELPEASPPGLHLGPGTGEDAKTQNCNLHLNHLFIEGPCFEPISTLSKLGCISVLFDNYSRQGRSQPHHPGWAKVPLSSFFLKFRSIFPTFPQTFLIFFLTLALRVGDSPTREGPGYAIDSRGGQPTAWAASTSPSPPSGIN